MPYIYHLFSGCATSLLLCNKCDFQDCGFGDGGEGVCIPCEEGKFSTETGVAPCRRCTQCTLLNRREEAACSPTTDSLCGQCLPG
uniref:TNFR-Cys domain-containing protein n=1 Tax=Amphilophus citrinellus TaxID=61819 RepID=A0A3Q0RRT5_AMPCI